MAALTSKKLQVFVSSTFSDLVPERQAAVEAILTAGHIPAGMELFTAGDELQMDVIKRWIDESDVYLLILGARYGSIETKSGKSYTQLEYEYAISKNKPFFACVIKDEAIDTRVRTHGRSALETENPKQLKEFRALVLTKMCKFWVDSKDIKITIIETLSNLAQRDGLVGWVRADSLSNLPALADEIARLSKENAQLRHQLSTISQSDLINGFTFSELKHIFEQRGIIESLKESRYNLNSGISDEGFMLHRQRKMCDELSLRGLAVYNDAQSFYRLTESGRTFMNKLEAEELRTSTAGDSPQTSPVSSPAP